MDTRHSRRNERRAAGVIDRRIGRLRAGEVAPARVAWLIAAALHRGADSELKAFAESGVVAHHQAARLELHYTARDEPRFARWAAALGDYITWDERRGGGSGGAR